MSTFDAKGRAEREVAVSYLATDWLRMVYAIHKSEAPGEPQILWWGRLASRSQVLFERLKAFDEDGVLSLPPEGSLSVVLFELLDYGTTVLASDIEYGWPNVLDEFNEPWDWKGQEKRISGQDPIIEPRVFSLAEAVVAVRKQHNNLLQILNNHASPLEMGKVLRRLFIDVARLLIALECELRFRDQ